MPVLSDESERFAVNRSDLLMRTYRLTNTREESTTLLVSTLAHHMCVHVPINNKDDVESACEAVKMQLSKYLRSFIADRK